MFEKRKVERFDLRLKTYVSVPGELPPPPTYRLITRDVSTGGAYLLTDKPLPIGTKVKIDMILSLGSIKAQGAKKALIKAAGAVLRTDAEGMAISFDENSRILPYSEKLWNKH